MLNKGESFQASVCAKEAKGRGLRKSKQTTTPDQWSNETGIKGAGIEREKRGKKGGKKGEKKGGKTVE